MKAALVTGGAGFLGSHLCERLLKEGYRVVALDNLYTGSRANMKAFAKHPNFTFIKADVTGVGSCKSMIEHKELWRVKWDEIYNLACPASPVHYQAKPLLTTMSSISGVLHCLDLAIKNKAKFLHTSTSEIYGDPLVHPQEEHYWGNVNTIGIRSCYDEGKRVAETLIADAVREYDVDARMVRIFNTYGPRMHPQDGRVISNFIMQAMHDEDITIFGDGTQTRSFQYCDDLIDAFRKYMKVSKRKVRAFFKAHKLGAPVINTGNPDEYTIGQLAEKTLEMMPTSKSRVVYRPLPGDDPKKRRPDITLAKELLGWEPKVPLATGLAKTIDYFRHLGLALALLLVTSACGAAVESESWAVTPGKTRIYLPNMFGVRVNTFPQPGEKAFEPWCATDDPTVFKLQAWGYPHIRQTMPWLEVNDGDKGLYAAVHSADAAWTATPNVLYRAKERRLEVSFSFDAPGPLPKPVFERHAGDWHVGAERYRSWSDTIRTVLTPPDFVRNMTGWLLVIMKQQNGDIVWPYRDMKALAATAKAHGLNWVGLFGWTAGGHDHLYPDYDPDPGMGGAATLREGIQALHAAGLRVFLYANGQLEEREATDFWKTHGREAAVVCANGQTLTETWKKYSDSPARHFDCACLWSEAWYGKMLEATRKAVGLGADGMLYDQLGVKGATRCFATSHGHQPGAVSFGPDRSRLLSRLRAETARISPNFVLLTEGCVDSVLDSVSAFHGWTYGWSAPNLETRMDPKAPLNYWPELMRYTFPEIVSSVRYGSPLAKRSWVNAALVMGLRHDVEVRYVPDRAYAEKGRVPELSEYGTVCAKPDLEALRTGNHGKNRGYLARVSAFQKLHGDYLLRGRFVDTTGFSMTADAHVIAKRFVADDGSSGVLAWNMADTPQSVRIEGLGPCVAAYEPETGRVSADCPLAGNAIRLFLFGEGRARQVRNADWGLTDAYSADWESRGGRITVTQGQLGKDNFRGGGHQQGLACSEDYIFFGASSALGKIDWKGNPVKVRQLWAHMGDVAWYKGRIYATWARSEGGGRVPKDKRTNVIAVFDENLEEIEEYEIKGVPGIDGITVLDDVIYFGAGAAERRDFHRVNRIGRMTLDFKFLGWTEIDIGVNVNYGVQNMTAADGKIYCFFYTHLGDAKGSPVTCGIFDKDLKLLETRQAYSGMGIDVAPKRFQTVPGKTVFLRGSSSYPPPGSGPEFVRLRYGLQTLR